MRVATYNVWNSDINWPARLEAIAEELLALNADIVALQEAPTWASDGVLLADYLRDRTSYEWVVHLEEPEVEPGEWPEGLAILSKLPCGEISANWQGERNTENNWAVRAVVAAPGGRSLGLTNVHLDWRDTESRERHITAIVRGLIDAQPRDYELLCGDVNDVGESLVLPFLEGNAEIEGYRTNWRDLVAEAHSLRGEDPPPTLDFATNPRWRDSATTESPRRVDRIYGRSEAGSGPIVAGGGLFGREPVSRSGVVASDHYGVFVDLDL